MKTYTTEQLKKIIETSYDAGLLLNEHFPKAGQKFNRLTNQLHELLEEIKTVFPDANYYTASGGFNLLLGNHHNDDYGISANLGLDALCAPKLRVDDGDY